MKNFSTNINDKEKIVRMIVGSFITGLSVNSQKNSKFIGIIGVSLMLSGVLNYCPLYDYLNINNK